MINKTTKVENNKYKVTFNFKPSNIKHTRKNSRGTYTATHVANGTTSRYGIWEGIEIVEVWTKTGDNAWRSHGTSSSVTIETSKNDVKIQGKATYRLKTMGHHWNDLTGTYPFFWFGNVDEKPSKYRKGFFTDKTPIKPGNEHYYCVVPSDWTYKKIEWSNWAYKHAQDTKNWAIDNGKFEQRNSSYESAKVTNGWISDNNRQQMWRKSMLFSFEKTYTSSVTSSGISTYPNSPVLTVTYAKGDSGKITVKHTDPAGKSATVKVNAICNGKTATVISYGNSGTLKNGDSKTYTIKFPDFFSESYRANDIKYEAWTKNTLGYVCKTSSGVKGVHRYNGRPTVPTGISVVGATTSSVIYDKINVSWKSSTDPDKDTVMYDVYLKATDANNKIVKDGIISSSVKTNKLSNFSISNYSDNTSFQIKVRAYDGKLYSSWSTAYSFQKGGKPNNKLSFAAPSVSNTTLYNQKPRFFLKGYDQKSTVVFVLNGKEYDSVNNPTLFSMTGNVVVFKPSSNIEKDKQFSCYAYLKNKYGKGPVSITYKFTIKNPTENITEGKIIKATDVNDVNKLIKTFAKAYNLEFEASVSKGNVIKTSSFNKSNDFLKSVAKDLNDLIKDTNFHYNYDLNNVIAGQIIDDALWDTLVSKLKKI